MIESSAGEANNMVINTKIRQPAVAGLFYPEKKASLDQNLAYLLEESRDYKIPGQIFGLIVPHAGYAYSGGVAARAYRQILDQDFETVIIIAPSHCEYFTEISIYDGFAYATPLGSLPIDQDLARRLSEASPQIILSEKGHRFDEHALEVQLPFLQKVLQKVKIIPVVMGEHSKENISALSAAIFSLVENKKMLVVASTDLSHFYQTDRAENLDNIAVGNIENFDEHKLFLDLQNGNCEMCGGGPAIATMQIARLLGADQSKVLLYRNSGDITGDRKEVVGYLSAVLFKTASA